MCRGLRKPPIRPDESSSSERTVEAAMTKDLAKVRPPQSLLYSLIIVQHNELADIDAAVDAVKSYAVSHSYVEVLLLTRADR